jgi:hypothetical protein
MLADRPEQKGRTTSVQSRGQVDGVEPKAIAFVRPRLIDHHFQDVTVALIANTPHLHGSCTHRNISRSARS